MTRSARLCERFGDDYWLAKDRDGGFPDDFHRALAEGGWLGVASRRTMAARASASPRRQWSCRRWRNRAPASPAPPRLHMNIFGLNPVVVFGSDEQKQRLLPPLIAGKDKACFAVTEPDVGLDTLKLKTRAVREATAT